MSCKHDPPIHQRSQLGLLRQTLSHRTIILIYILHLYMRHTGALESKQVQCSEASKGRADEHNAQCQRQSSKLQALLHSFNTGMSLHEHITPAHK